MILTEKLYLTEDRKSVVREGDLKASFLLGVPGQKINDELAKKLGLIPEQIEVIATIPVRENSVQTRDPIVINRDPEIQQPRRRGRPPRAIQ